MSEPADPSPRFRPLQEEIREFERALITAALQASGGNKTEAAARIGMTLRTFLAKLKRLGSSSMA